MNPTLRNAFYLWGSINVFIYVRFQILFFGLLKLDWALNYTYSILAAAAISYPLTMQDPLVYWMLVLPVLYGPFHERICRWFGWVVEDDITGTHQPKDLHMHEKTVKTTARMSLIVASGVNVAATAIASRNSGRQSPRSSGRSAKKTSPELSVGECDQELQRVADDDSVKAATDGMHTVTPDSLTPLAAISSDNAATAAPAGDAPATSALPVDVEHMPRRRSSVAAPRRRSMSESLSETIKTTAASFTTLTSETFYERKTSLWKHARAAMSGYDGVSATLPEDESEKDMVLFGMNLSADRRASAGNDVSRVKLVDRVRRRLEG